MNYVESDLETGHRQERDNAMMSTNVVLQC